MSKKIIDKIVEKNVDDDFDFSEISDKINYSRYEKPKPAPRLKYWTVGALSATAVAVLAISVVYPIVNLNKNTSKTQNAVVEHQDEWANYGRNDQAAPYSEATASKPAETVPVESASPNGGGQGGAAVTPAPAPSETADQAKGGGDQAKGAETSSAEEETNKKMIGNLAINGTLARFIANGGAEKDLALYTTYYKTANGNSITLQDFSDGEEVEAEFDENEKTAVIRKMN